MREISPGASSTKTTFEVSVAWVSKTVPARIPTAKKGMSSVPMRKLRLTTLVRHSRAMTAPINPPLIAVLKFRPLSGPPLG